MTFDAVADCVNDPAMLAVTSAIRTAVKLCVTIDASVISALLLASASTVNVLALANVACAITAKLTDAVTLNELLRVTAVSLILNTVVDCVAADDIAVSALLMTTALVVVAASLNAVNTISCVLKPCAVTVATADIALAAVLVLTMSTDKLH